MCATSRLTGLGLILVVLATLSGCQQATSTVEAASPARDIANPDAVVVSTVQPARTTLRRTSTQPATVRAYYKADIYAKAAGFLVDLKADIGQSVEPNEVLGVLAVPETVKVRESQQAEIRRLQAEEQRATAGVALSKANVQAAVAFNAEAHAEIAKAESQLAANRIEFDRVQQLVNDKAVATRLLDEARKKLEVSEAEKSAAEASLESAKANVAVAQAKQTSAEADLETAQAETSVAQRRLEEIETLLGYAELRAPFAGVVTERNVDPGDLVRNTQNASETPRKPLFTVMHVHKVRVQVMVPEKDAPWATVGDVVALKFQSLPGRPFDGKISRLAKSLDESTRTMLVEVDLPNPDGALLPGMYGEATIVLDEHSGVLVLPSSSVRYDERGRSFVYTVDEAGTISVVDVTVGLDDGQQTEIINGLKDNASVVDATIGRLYAGQKVQINKR
ncbi:MAG: efflux RND transporter periplasmic adaptor subunit [Bacteroidetes bacterium]|nr:efflux RND transporter periplasmic adaptor subunit [Bacteroidota bacterium]